MPPRALQREPGSAQHPPLWTSATPLPKEDEQRHARICLSGRETREKAPGFFPKGKEAKLPPPRFFIDKDGHVRTEIRTRWYLPAEGHTYGTYALQSDEIVCPVPLPQAVIDAAAPYPAEAKPVFFGHYWLSATRPALLAENVACLDYSVAKGGFLCAYRWQEEKKLTDEHFVWLPAAS
jgi:hypothetical protein